MKGFKERCKVLEMELESTRGFENSALAGGPKKNNDYELKQMREVYDRKLNKANEEVGKKNLAIRDLEQECSRLREEVHSGAAFERDQLLAEVNRCRMEV